MAGMFYSLQEAAEKLNMTEEQVKDIVKHGRLREFRDGSSLLFKVDEVEALMSDTSITASKDSSEKPQEGAAAAEEEVASLEEAPAPEEELLPMEEESGEGEISLSPEASEGSTMEAELSDADTAITSEGINVLDDTEADYKLADDTMGETQAASGSEASLEEIEEDVNLDTFGSGSGLLDLSLQADDTSLGGILDEIYTPEGEQGQLSAEASAADVAAEAEQMLPEEGIIAQQSAAMVQGYVEPAPDTSSNTFGFMLFLPLLAVVYTCIVAVSGLFDVMPVVLEKTRGIILYVLGGFALVALIMTVMGVMSGGSGSVKKPKEKKAKPRKEKKAKKEKK